MKLYTVVGSPNSRKVEAVINRLGLPIERVYLDFFTGDLKQTAHLALNGNGMVPVLQDGDFPLWETNAINQYLCDKAQADNLFPREPRLRAQVVQWQCWELAHFNKAFGIVAFEMVARPAFGLGEPNQALVDVAKADLARFAAVLDKHLQSRETVVGDHLTIADYAIIHIEMFKEMIAFDWRPYPDLNRYFDRMRKDPHWAKTAPPSVEAIGRKPRAAA